MTEKLQHLCGVLIVAMLPVGALCATHMWENGTVLDARTFKASVDTGAMVTTSTSGVGQNAETTGQVSIQSTTVTTTQLVIVGRDFAYTVMDSREQDSLMPHEHMVSRGIVQAITNRHHGCRFIVNNEVQFYQDRNILHVIDADHKECSTDIIRQERITRSAPPLPVQQIAPVGAARPTLRRDPILDQDLYSVGPGITQPSVIFKVSPIYTADAHAAGLSGPIMLTIVVGSDGKAHDIHVLRGLGMGLDEKAVEAVQEWRFKPGTKDGQPVNVRATIEVNFRLRNDPP